MPKNKYATTFALIKHIKQFDPEYSSAEAVKSFTNGATTSLKDVPDNQLFYLNQMLQQVAASPNQKKDYSDDPRDKQRKAIIAIFKSHGKTVADAKDWVFRQGVQGEHKQLNDYNGQQLFSLTRQAEKYLRK